MTKTRERIRRELTADPRLVQAVVDAVHDRVPAYADLDGERLLEVRAIAGWAVERLLHLWAVDDTVGPDELRRFRGIAAARAADGRPLQAVLRAYRVAAAVLVDEVAARAPRSAAADAFALTRHVLATLDALSEAMAGAYTATSEQLAGDRARALRLLLDDLIAGRHASAGAAADRAARLGVQLPAPYCLLAAEPDGCPGAALPQETALDLLAALAGDATPLVTAHGRRAVLLLPAASARTVAPVLRERGWRGCAIQGEGLDRVAVAHRLADGALDAAPPHARRPGRLLTDADAHVLALLGGHPAAAPDRIAHLVLGPLTEPDHRHLLAALTAYLDTGSATAAARTLHLHPQSLRYRLRRARELTGLDERDPWERLMLDIARTVGARA
ncbi:helix-turn-helix domain-containing protein [Streptomyces sp. AV19]|uniref:PucR family transcriptional regulator n=1 Tax=Streptomyces sp. AV19 TaxID=2793068 RepID=UPI0018FE16D8|nr:helix-turn-helix domain-containing protein [Streptomyces sp. AV19]MBH1938724.1 helix-turn-helix domain-containing protein [Streptomyces sp. AV19]MDG4533985.1 helix-turn-helix domain-containing protein [Streptomyces sp. AV19]